jgi:hypothetical protein
MQRWHHYQRAQQAGAVGALQSYCADHLSRFPHYEEIDRGLAALEVLFHQLGLLQQLDHTRSITRALRLY